ncbi:hypothetical protein XHC_0159 [Xanthomonas hortorum pv. carotae str. M081]|nr:hypothetical protein XHC_0159 [Xanthomonas hortorum pv. carotae str. M081]
MQSGAVRFPVTWPWVTHHVDRRHLSWPIAVLKELR